MEVTMSKILRIFLPSLIILLILSSCSSSTVTPDNLKIYYNDKVYDCYDNSKRYAESSWEIYGSETKKIDAYLGCETDTDKTPNITAEVFTDPKLNMFMRFDDTLYCDENYQFPDYRNGSEIEKIIITPNNETDFLDPKCAVITDSRDIKVIQDFLIKSSNHDNYSGNQTPEKPQTNDSDVGIVYKNFPAIFYCGYISINSNGEYGFYCSDVNSQNYLFNINPEIVKVLDKYPNWFDSEITG